MKVVDFLKNFINKFRNKNQNKLLLNSPENLYEDLIKSPKIENMINSMPKGLSKIEQAYYIYLELGKIVSESPYYVFVNMEEKEKKYNNKIDSNYYGICKSISELYVNILKDDRIGIEADLVKKYPELPITHIDTILKIDGKNYITNLISDLSRIKTSRRVNSFCFDLTREENDSRINDDKKLYLERLENYYGYGKIHSLTRKDIEQLDKKLGYSYFIPQMSKDYDRGLYTEDVIKLLKEDMDNPESFKKYVLHDKDVPKEEYFKYKLDYLFENIDKYTDYTNNMNYLEQIRYLIYVARKLFEENENMRIIPYVATINGDLNNIVSILKIRPSNENDNETKNNNLYYIYSNEKRKYEYKTPEEMRNYLNSLEKNSLQIIGMADRYSPRDISELEL